MQRADIVDIVARYEAALILDALHCTGVLVALQAPAPASELARRCNVSVGLLEPLLAFAAASCTLVERRPDGCFALGGEARDLGFAGHMLDQYIGGYGPALGVLPRLLRAHETGAAFVDLRRHAAAFATDEPETSLSEAAKIILDLGVTGLVELGCLAQVGWVPLLPAEAASR